MATVTPWTDYAAPTPNRPRLWTSMQVSVVIPCFNSGPFLASAVRSAMEQSQPPLEVICVDDASEDDTPERLDRLREEFGDRLVVLRQSERAGIAAARNLAVQHSRGDWIGLLDHDDLWLPEKLARQEQLARAAPDAVLLHSRCWDQKEDDASTRTIMHDWKFLADAAPFPYLFLANFIVPCTVLLKKDALLRLGKFDARLDRHGKDDIDLWLRLAESGARFAHSEDPLAVRRIHPRNFSADAAPFLQGRFDVLLEAFERNLATSRCLLVSEGVVRLLGILFDRLATAIEMKDADSETASWEALESFTRKIPGYLEEETRLERMASRFPALMPTVSSLARRNRRPEVHHKLEVAAAAQASISEATHFLESRRSGVEPGLAVLRRLQEAAFAANRSARKAYRRRAEYEAARDGQPMTFA